MQWIHQDSSTSVEPNGKSLVNPETPSVKPALVIKALQIVHLRCDKRLLSKSESAFAAENGTQEPLCNADRGRYCRIRLGTRDGFSQAELKLRTVTIPSINGKRPVLRARACVGFTSKRPVCSKTGMINRRFQRPLSEDEKRGLGRFCHNAR
jgi:hypothetical protein